MREYEIYPNGFENCDAVSYDDMTPRMVEDMVKEFGDNGFTITEAAIWHNYNAWRSDLKSGYRDDENHTFLFTPCGCNALRFNATEVEGTGEPWQTTYEC